MNDKDEIFQRVVRELYNWQALEGITYSQKCAIARSIVAAVTQEKP